MEKKGLQREMVVYMIIVIATLLILVIFWTEVSSVLYGQTPVETCRTSVLAHSMGEKPLVPHMSLECPRKFVHIDNDGYKTYFADELPVEEQDLTYEFTFEDGEPSRGEIYEIIAEEMTECWYKMRGGAFDSLFAGYQGKYSCLVCAEVIFSDDFNLEMGNFGEFNRFLQEEETIRFGEEMSYAEYFLKDARYSSIIGEIFLKSGYGTNNEGLFFQHPDTEQLDGRKINLYPADEESFMEEGSFYVVFREIPLMQSTEFKNREGNTFELKNDFDDWGGGPTDNFHYIYLVEAERAPEECFALVN